MIWGKPFGKPWGNVVEVAVCILKNLRQTHHGSESQLTDSTSYLRNGGGLLSIYIITELGTREYDLETDPCILVNSKGQKTPFPSLNERFVSPKPKFMPSRPTNEAEFGTEKPFSFEEKGWVKRLFGFSERG